MATAMPMIVATNSHRPGPSLWFHRNRRSCCIEPRHPNARDSLAPESEALRRRLRKIDSASAYVRTAIVDPDHHRPAIVKIHHARIRTERQGARGSGKAM